MLKKSDDQTIVINISSSFSWPFVCNLQTPLSCYSQNTWATAVKLQSPSDLQHSTIYHLYLCLSSYYATPHHLGCDLAFSCHYYTFQWTYSNIFRKGNTWNLFFCICSLLSILPSRFMHFAANDGILLFNGQIIVTDTTLSVFGV